MSEGSPYRYMAWVLLIMVPCFGLWYAGGALPASPAFYLSKLGLKWALPEVVYDVTLSDTRMLVVTQFGEVGDKIVSAAKAGHQMAYPVDTRLHSFSIPFFAALLFASRVRQPVERFCRGLLVLWLLMALGLFVVCLKNLMLGLGEVLYSTSSVALPPPPVIALLYQLFTLIVPTLAPILLWVWMARDSALLQRIWSYYGKPEPETQEYTGPLSGGK